MYCLLCCTCAIGSMRMTDQSGCLTPGRDGFVVVHWGGLMNLVSRFQGRRVNDLPLLANGSFWLELRGLREKA